MRENIAAVDIGDRWVTVARLGTDSRGHYRLLDAGLLSFPDAVEDVELAKALRLYWRQDCLPTRTVCAGFRSRAVSIKNFQYPAMTDSELSSALRLEATELLALDHHEIVWDWRLSPASRNGGSSRTEGILVTAPRRPVEDRLRLLRAAGLYPVRLDVPGLAVARLIGGSPNGPGPEETMAILNLGGGQADIVILSQATIFPRTVYLEKGSWEEHPAELTAHLVDAIRYARYSLKQGTVHRLYLTGLISDGPALIDHLRTNTQLEVELWNPLERMALRLHPSWRCTEALQATPTALTSCLGLALDPDPT